MFYTLIKYRSLTSQSMSRILSIYRRGFIKGRAQGKLTSCEWDLTINLPGCFHLLVLLSVIRKTKNAWLKTPTDLLHKNLMKPLISWSIAELQWPKGPPREADALSFSWLSWLVVVVLVNMYTWPPTWHGWATQDSSHTPTKIVYSVFLWHWTSMLWSVDTCQIKISTDRYHVSVMWAQA